MGNVKFFLALGEHLCQAARNVARDAAALEGLARAIAWQEPKASCAGAGW